MNAPPMISPNLLPNLSGFYPSLALIEGPTQSTDTYGDPTETWSTAYASIPCVVAARSVDQRLSSDSVLAVHSVYISLAGYYPLITDSMRATVGGVVWNILGVEHDSHSQTTRLQVKRAI